MMLDIIEERNPELVRLAVELHQSGEIPPDTYLVDLDTMRENTRGIAKCAENLGLRLYVMTKQWSRNPSINKAIAEEGIEKAVAVDIEGINHLYEQGMKIGHVGHLVSVPRHQTKRVLKMEPDIWTVYGYDNARFVSEGAEKLGVTQDLLLKVVKSDDYAYTAQEGGIPLIKLTEEAKKIMALPGINIVGTTGFPTILYDQESNQAKALPNMKSVIEGARILREELGIDVSQINCPGTSSCASMEIVKKSGGTDAEPGSSLWGMAPQQLFGDDFGKPAQVYVSEVSHYDGDRQCVIGGGYYPDVYLDAMAVKEAFVGTSSETILDDRVKAELPDPKWIEYYGWLYPGLDRKVKTGDTVVYFFRPQTFYTRSANIATVSGLKDNNPKIEGIYDRGSRPVSY